ncbi:mitochondrial 2-enoyl thioester reductase [Pseudocyphellaria aurata]|nr:mitochondrial 2-enoyl thioester reductase [Pseudocyphellaria aurata]
MANHPMSLKTHQLKRVWQPLSLHSYSISPPYSTLVTLRTLSAVVNPSDVNQIQGAYPILPPFTDALSTPTPSAVPGNEGCFEVIATGSAVKTVARGDWVIPRSSGLGTWRTHLQVDEGSIIRIDKEGLGHLQAATVTVNPLSAWRLLKDFVDLKEGDWFVQNGASSSVGQTVIQLAKLWGLKNIAIVRDRVDEGATESLKSWLQQMGATAVFTHSECKSRGFSDVIQGVTNGEELRLGLNCAGGEMMTKTAKMLSPGGQLVTYGNMSRHATRVSTSSMIFRDIVYRGFWLTRWSEAHPEEKRKTVEQLLELLRENTLQCGISRPTYWGMGVAKETLIQPISRTFSDNRYGKDCFVFEEKSADVDEKKSDHHREQFNVIGMSGNSLLSTGKNDSRR